MNSKKISKSDKFRTANLARCVYSIVMILVFSRFDLPWIIGIGLVHFLFALVWLILIEYEFLDESLLWWSGYLPATFDLIWLTVLAYGTGHVTSFFILGYLGSIALSSMSIDRNYGAYNAILATFLYTTMGILVYFEILPMVNIMMPVVKPTLLSIVISSSLLGGSAFIVNQVVSRLFFSLSDVNEKLLAIAMTDPLTLLPNRRSFLTNMETEIARKLRSVNEYPISFILFDLDHFKEFNDKYGHDCGDMVLVEFSSVISKSIRKQDFPARWGGEEFIILLPDTNLKGALVVAEKIRKATESLLLRFDGNQIQCTVSSGVAVLLDKQNTAEEIIKKADQFLYEAKKRGRNQVYSSSLQE